MLFIDDWHDLIRLFNMSIGILCVFFLSRRFLKHNHQWNTKTRDLWYALNMWCVAGIAISFESILRNAGPTPRMLFIFIAFLVTLKGLKTRGSWGSGAP